jgi:hypothetical protein
MSQLSLYNDRGQFSPPLVSPTGITGAFNSVNQTFLLTATPVWPEDMMLFLRPTTGGSLYLIQGIDYQLSGCVITLTTPPAPGGFLVAI